MISTEGRASFDFCLLPHRAQLAATRPSDTAREQGRGGERVGKGWGGSAGWARAGGSHRSPNTTVSPCPAISIPPPPPPP